MTANFAKATPTGLVFDEKAKPTYEQWAELGETLTRAEKCIGFAIGDWINFGQKKWGERYKDALQITGLDYGTLRVYASVANSVPLLTRSNKLTFAHHRQVAALKPDAQKKWIGECERALEKDDYIGKRQLARSIEAGRLIPSSELATPSPDKGFHTHIQAVTRLTAFWRDFKESGRELTESQKHDLRLDFKPLAAIIEEMSEAGVWPTETELATAEA